MRMPNAAERFLGRLKRRFKGKSSQRDLGQGKGIQNLPSVNEGGQTSQGASSRTQGNQVQRREETGVSCQGNGSVSRSGTQHDALWDRSAQSMKAREDLQEWILLRESPLHALRRPHEVDKMQAHKHSFEAAILDADIATLGEVLKLYCDHQHVRTDRVLTTAILARLRCPGVVHGLWRDAIPEMCSEDKVRAIQQYIRPSLNTHLQLTLGNIKSKVFKSENMSKTSHRESEPDYHNGDNTEPRRAPVTSAQDQAYSESLGKNNTVEGQKKTVRKKRQSHKDDRASEQEPSEQAGLRDRKPSSPPPPPMPETANQNFSASPVTAAQYRSLDSMPTGMDSQTLEMSQSEDLRKLRVPSKASDQGPSYSQEPQQVPPVRTHPKTPQATPQQQSERNHEVKLPKPRTKSSSSGRPKSDDSAPKPRHEPGPAPSTAATPEDACDVLELLERWNQIKREFSNPNLAEHLHEQAVERSKNAKLAFEKALKRVDLTKLVEILRIYCLDDSARTNLELTQLLLSKMGKKGVIRRLWRMGKLAELIEDGAGGGWMTQLLSFRFMREDEIAGAVEESKLAKTKEGRCFGGVVNGIDESKDLRPNTISMSALDWTSMRNGGIKTTCTVWKILTSKVVFQSKVASQLQRLMQEAVLGTCVRVAPPASKQEVDNLKLSKPQAIIAIGGPKWQSRRSLNPSDKSQKPTWFPMKISSKALSWQSIRLARRAGETARLVPTKSSWLDGKSKPGPTKSGFENLQNTTIPPASRNLELRPEEAYTLAEEALKSYHRTQIACLTKKPPNLTAIKRNLPFQVFNQLDGELFRSMLKGNVSLSWSDLPDGTFSRTIRAGQNGNPRTTIELSPLLFHHGTRPEILSTLIHQMVHAYYLQCCSYRERGFGGEGHDLGHEQAFGALVNCIRGHVEPLRDYLSAALWTPSRKYQDRLADGCSCYGSSGELMEGASSCYHEKNSFNAVDIQGWRDNAIAITESLRDAQQSKNTEIGKNDRSYPRTVIFLNKDGREDPPRTIESGQYPREAYFLLRLDDRYYPVARSSVADLAALTSSPYFHDKLYLQLPEGTTFGIFQILYLFLAHGELPPSLTDLDEVWAYLDLMDHKAPKIEARDRSAPDRLVPLIAAFQLGTTLRYKPFCDHALKGLRTLRATADDPIAALERIYGIQSGWKSPTMSSSSGLPDPRLREWVVTWLGVPLLSANMSHYGAKSKTNLGVVSKHPDWREKFTRLKARSAELAQDVNTTEQSLIRRYGNGVLGTSVEPLEQNFPTPLEDHYCLPMQQPLGIPGSNQSFPDSLPTQHNNTPLLYPDGNPKIFDLSSLRNSLPSNATQDRYDRSWALPEHRLRREEYHAMMAMMQQGWLRDVPNTPRPWNLASSTVQNVLSDFRQPGASDRGPNR
ncbi:MAG: hypothetical protein Q9181_005831 [Wetmoreana brouardii]